MIWFLRVFLAFFLILVIGVSSQDEHSLTQSTTTDLKFEPAIKAVIQSYGPKVLRIPSLGESLEGKLDGDEIKILITEIVNNERISLEITGFTHLEKETVKLVFEERENHVQITSTLDQKTKKDSLSRLIFLFFGQNSLQVHSNTISSTLIPSK